MSRPIRAGHCICMLGLWHLMLVVFCDDPRVWRKVTSSVFEAQRHKSRQGPGPTGKWPRRCDVTAMRQRCRCDLKTIQFELQPKLDKSWHVLRLGGHDL